jgi:uncharacterized cupin superfamily protein
MLRIEPRCASTQSGFHRSRSLARPASAVLKEAAPSRGCGIEDALSDRGEATLCVRLRSSCLGSTMHCPKEFVSAAAIAEMPWEERTHLLNSSAIRLAKSLSGAAGLTQLGFHVMSVLPGHEYSEYHRHLYEEQCFYVLSGRGEALIDEEKISVGPGDFLGFPRNGVAHTIANNGDEPLVLLAARTMLEQDVCDYPHKNKRLYMTGTEEALVDFSEIMR